MSGKTHQTHLIRFSTRTSRVSDRRNHWTSLDQILGEAGKADSPDDCEAFVGRSGFGRIGRQGEVDKPFWGNAAHYGFDEQNIETLNG